MRSHPIFVPNDKAGSRKDTAVLLVGTAREFGIDQHDIKSSYGGFNITQDLADVLYDESTKGKKKPSQTRGNRAAKNTGTSRTEQE